MVKKLKDKIVIIELIFTIVSAIFIMIVGTMFFNDVRLEEYLFNTGVDQLGSLICAALIFGSMRQKGDGTKFFRVLILCSSASFAANIAMYYTLKVPEYSTTCFILCMISKLIDLVMIFCFYQYVNSTLNFSGMLKKIADKGIPVLMTLETVVLLSNIFAPVTFYIDADGMYQSTDISWLEDIYLIAVSVTATVLIVRSSCPRSQKAAALTFIFFPIAEYLLTGAMFGNAGQYGVILVSLVIMYCIIFNDKSKKVASTQIELNLATQIQSSMLPNIFPAFPERKEFDIHASMTPAKEVGGDFYDLFMVDDDHLAMVIADVSGKGIPAALFMMSSKILINDHTIMGGTPAEILERVNKQIYSTNKANMFVTVWLGILEISTGKLTTANAGHEYPFLNLNGNYEIFKDKHGLAIGAAMKSKYRDHEIMLKKGDSLFVYTDGVAEATNANNELFGTERTLEALNALPKDNSQEDMLKGVRQYVDAFVKEAPQFDDLTMLGLKYYGPEGK